MTTNTATPPPPKLGPLVAALLEIGMLGCFAFTHPRFLGVIGVVLWAAYFRFSALRAVWFDRFTND